MEIKSKNIETCLPLLCWENGCIINKTADVTVPFELELPQVFTMGSDEFDNIHQTWVRAVRTLPDYSIVHRQEWFYSSVNNIGCKEKVSFLDSESDKHFSLRRYLRHKSFLYISQSSSRHFSKTSVSSALCSGRIIEIERLDNDKIKNFLDAVGQFCSILNENGIVCRRLTEEEVIGSKERFGIIEQYISLNIGADKPQPLCDIVTANADMKVGDNYVSCFSISDLEQLPSEVHTYSRHSKFSTDSTLFAIGYTFDFGLGMPFDHIYNQYIFLEPHREVINAIEKRGREQQSLSRISRENAINKQFNDQYLNESVINARRCVRSAANIVIWDKNYLQLLKKNRFAGSVLANKDFTVVKSEGIVPQIFWGGIPGAASELPEEMTFLTFLEQACCFCYNEGNSRSIGDGFGLRLCDRIFGMPLNIDISDYPRDKGWIDNRNKFILGPSGSGKSFFTNHLVRQYYEKGTHIVIVDVGDSYQGLARLINTESKGADCSYFKFDDDSPFSFNPFYVGDGRYTVEKLEQIAALIFCLWKNESEIITKAEETHISVAINGYVETLKKSDEFACFDSFYEYMDTSFRKQLEKDKVLRIHFDLDNLLQVLSPYYKGGMYHYLLNAKENMDLLDKRFIVFEIDNIKDHKTLFPVVTLVLMDTFISKMRHPSLASERKVILIEEAWKAISKSGTAQFIKYLFKTVRKHFGEAIVVTQEIEDIVGNEIIKNTIISNADCKILLDQRKYANKFDEIRNTLALTEKESAIALSINRDIKTKGRNPYKEVFITLNGNFTGVYGVEVSRSEYLTYTTEKKEKELLLKKERETGSFIEAVKSLASEQI